MHTSAGNTGEADGAEDKKPAVRVGVLGAGVWARRTHLPNLQRLPGVEVVALCDVDEESCQDTAQSFGVPRTYGDGHQMLEQEKLDALFSVLPAFARTDVEAAAARSGVHLFSEKPQALDMATARAIAQAVHDGNVISTVCFRERYRPLFKEARRLLAGKKVTHIRFMMAGGLPVLQSEVTPEQEKSWHFQMDKAGGNAFDWGVHAVDYSRYMSGLDVVQAQAFYHHPPQYNKPLSCSFNFMLTGGATMSMTFLATAPTPPAGEPPFTVFYEGGYLSLWMYDRLEMNGEVVYRAEDFDPWFEQDRVFVEAVRRGDAADLLNDYQDGLLSLAPVLAGWQSARTGGGTIDVAAFAAA
jgi:predicted dehydrogenase